jgi:hypothetical protein
MTRRFIERHERSHQFAKPVHGPAPQSAVIVRKTALTRFTPPIPWQPQAKQYRTGSNSDNVRRSTYPQWGHRRYFSRNDMKNVFGSAMLAALFDQGWQ